MALRRVVTLDALGTLVELERPAPRLVAELSARGVRVDESQAAAALRAEIAYYRAHHDGASDAATLALLRDRCAEVLRGALQDAGADLGALAQAKLREALLASLHFRAYDDVPAVLANLRAAGHRLVVVSNWDVSLHEMLRMTGLRSLVDGAISSAEAGARKPSPEIFRHALQLAGVVDAAQPALHVGDSLELDVAGALGAGLRAVLVSRTGAPPPELPAGVPLLTTLDGLPALAA
ncbi:MAG TPA: HAD family hydrolase [Solirubrobacteraceae bacterium]|nr:HAD family hydrolase [Solirubrobacteraceae bacterium]